MAPSALLPQPIPSAVKPQSILKRKRNARLEAIADSTTSAKRPRVAFGPDVEFKISDDISEKDTALIREEILQVLEQGTSGQQDEYEQLKSYFSSPLHDEDAPSSTLLRKYLLGLISTCPLLNKSFSDLVQAVLQHSWLGRDEAFVGVYIRFLGHLVSSQGGYLHNVLKMLVENFAHLSTSLGRPPPLVCPDVPKLQARLHAALKYVLRVVPSASSTLASVIAKSFPYADDSKRAHVRYARNLLQVTEYAPELKSEILDLITERLIKLDVQVQTDVDRLDEEMGDLLTFSHSEVQQSLDPHDDDDGAFSDAESDISDGEEEELDPEDERLKTLKSTVTKMDSFLELLFSSYSSSFSKGAHSSSATSTFDQLLSQFRKIILPTYRSRHTQFLLFHFAQQSPELVTRLIDTCIQYLTDTSRSNMLRLSSAAYLASFIARGVRITSDTVLYVFDTLSSYLERLRRGYEPTCRVPDFKKYGIYYATVQALIYIFCFRWRDLISKRRNHISGYTSDADSDSDADDSDLDEAIQSGQQDLIWALSIKETFSSNFASPLNPLKICAPEVVEEFAGIAHHLNFMYIYPKLRTNRQIRLHVSTGGPAASSTTNLPRETSLSNLSGERHLQLDAYFPFDPYNLPLSKHWLDGDYNDYRAPPGMGTEVQASAGRSEFESMGGKSGDADLGSDTEEEEEEDSSDDSDEEDDEDVLDEDQRTATPSEDQ